MRDELNTELLGEVIAGVEGALSEQRKELSPAKKAEVIRYLYQVYRQTNGTPTIVEETVELAASDVYRDPESGEWAVDLDDGRTMTGKNPEHLVRSAGRMRESQQRSDRFLEAWKQAVIIAGPRFFDVRVGEVSAADDKNQLRPKIDVITDTISELSRSERVFLIALLTFYNETAATELNLRECVSVYPRALAVLDAKAIRVLADLTENYGGW